MTGTLNQDVSSVFNSLSRPHIVCDLDLNIVKVNDTALEMLGRARAEVIGRSIQELATREFNKSIYEALDATSQDGITREIINKSGDYNLITLNVITRVNQYLIIETENITNLYKSNLKERIEAEKNTALISALNQAVLVIDLINQTIAPNNNCGDIFGDLSPLNSIFLVPISNFEEYDPSSDDNFQIPEADKFIDLIKTIQNVWLSGKSNSTFIHKATLVGEAIIHQKVSRWDFDGKPRGIFIMGSDLTDLFKYRDELANSNLKIRQILKNLNTWMVIFDEESGDAEFINPLGESHIRPNFIANLSLPKQEIIRNAIKNLYENGFATFQAPDESGERIIKTSISFLGEGDPGKRKILSVNTDITNEVEFEELKNQRFHATQVQQFAQGIAHDFGNISQSFDGYSKLLKGEVSSDRGQIMVDQLLNAAARALKISHRISEIARLQVVENDIVDIASLLESEFETLKSMIDDDVELFLEIDQVSNTKAYVNQLQVQRLIENIVENANRAMNGPGSINIQCGEDRKDRTLVLRISNTGPAIAKPIAERIFAPFTSTRKEDGAGLGLYLANEYLQSCGGKIELHNHHKDVAFEIRLPIPSGGGDK